MSGRFEQINFKIARRLFLAGISLGIVAAGCFAPPTVHAADTTNITISGQKSAVISPGIYGLNYVWNSVSGTEFGQFANTLKTETSFTLARFPGGWQGEWYDWKNNSEAGWPQAPESPGVDANTFLRTMPHASFVLKSRPAVANPRFADQLIAENKAVVAAYSGRVSVWEIGNEWWLQRGAQRDPAKRARNLANYAQFVGQLAPALKSINPNIKLYATGDWLNPADFVTMKQGAGSGWSSIDGISVHIYCGNLIAQSSCARIQDNLGKVRQYSGKSDIYVSEWAVGPRQSAPSAGLAHAGAYAFVFDAFVKAGVKYASVWPAARLEQNVALISDDLTDLTTNGKLFSWITSTFRGQSLKISGSSGALAAQRPDGSVGLIIPTDQATPEQFRIVLKGLKISKVVSAEVLESLGDPMTSNQGTTRPVPAKLDTNADGSSTLQLSANQSGTGWGIVRVVLH